VIEPVPLLRPTSAKDFDVPRTLYVYSDVLDELWYSGQWRNKGLSGALLVGGHFSDPLTGDAYLIVDGYVGGMHADDLTDYTRMLRREWKAALANREKHLPEGQILGWSVATCDESIEPDRAAVVLHNTFFNHPWQRGLWVPTTGAPSCIRPVGDGVENSPIAVIDRTGARPADPR